MSESNALDEFVFARRGELLAVPAVVLAALGKPDALSIALGLPLAFVGEGVRAWAVGYSGVTTRGDAVTAPALVTAGPYAYVRNPLYVGNFLTAAGFAIAFTGANDAGKRAALIAGALGTMLAVYSIVVPHEERYLKDAPPPGKKLLKQIEHNALTLCQALGYDMNTVEFAVENGVPYAIDFMNPVPDANIVSVGQENFDWLVDEVAELAIAKAKDAPVAMEMRWSALLGAAPVLEAGAKKAKKPMTAAKKPAEKKKIAGKAKSAKK